MSCDRDRVLGECLDGKKLVCLAITEAFAGSDVSGLRCTATKSDDGKFWIVNVGAKRVYRQASQPYISVLTLKYRARRNGSRTARKSQS